MNLLLLVLVVFILFIMMNKIDLFMLRLLGGFSKSKRVYKYFIIDTRGYGNRSFIFIRKLRI